MRLDRWLDILRPWPLLVVSVLLITGAVVLLHGSDRAADVATGLAVLGAVCLGAWIALLAAYGHHRDRPPEDDPS